MSDMDMSRRGLLKTSLFGAAAAGMTGIAAAAEAKSSKKAPVYDAIVVGVFIIPYFRSFLSKKNNVTHKMHLH